MYPFETFSNNFTINSRYKPYVNVSWDKEQNEHEDLLNKKDNNESKKSNKNKDHHVEPEHLVDPVRMKRNKASDRSSSLLIELKGLAFKKA